MVSVVRQNFHEEVEAAINRQINMELYASYVYQSMAFYFDRDDVALHGFSKFFKHNSDEEREHAEKFMTYQNKRGGRVVLRDIAKPAKDEWGTGLEALETALELEKQVNQALLDVHVVGGTRNDPHVCDFLESEFLDEQVDAIKKLGDMITQLKRAGPGLGEHLFDKELHK
jgi:ferritin heavy chain